MDNAHIIPFRESHDFPPVDMLALCPTCHRMADKGDYSEEYLRKLKTNPCNKKSISERFVVEGKDLILHMGKTKFVNCSKLIQINNFEILSMAKEDEGDITLNLKLFDKFDNLIAEIIENKWTVFTQSIWDLEFKPKYIKIWNKPKDIIFEIKIENGEIYILGKLYYKGISIIISKDSVNIGGNNIPMTMLEGVTAENCGDCAINFTLNKSN